MKIVSWNINGIRTLESFDKILDKLDADIICFQETKVSRCQLDSSFCKLNGFLSFYSFPKIRIGQSGVSNYYRRSTSIPSATSYQFNNGCDDEGRILISHHNTTDGPLKVINVYVPCGYEDGGDDERYNAKLNFLNALIDYVKSLLALDLAVLLVGDLNVKASVMDSADALQNCNDPLFLEKWLKTKDKLLFRELLNLGMVDCFRYFNPSKKHVYTCWNTSLKARINNYGTRIDYIMVSHKLKDRILSFQTLSDTMGSDHCPIRAEIDVHMISSEAIPLDCTVFYPELTGKQSSLRDLINVAKPQDSISVPLSTAKAVSIKRKLSTNNKSKPLKQAKLSAFSEIISSKNVAGKACNKASGSASTEYTSTKKAVPSMLLNLLSGLPKPPKCSSHRLEATLRTVVKQGPNKGRRFYCCQLPVGPSHLETSQCSFFLWFEDHQKRLKNIS